LVDRTRSKQLFSYQLKQAVFLRILLGHDFFIGKARLWLAERAKSRGGHGGALETGFQPLALTPQPWSMNHKPQTSNLKPQTSNLNPSTLNPTPYLPAVCPRWKRVRCPPLQRWETWHSIS